VADPVSILSRLIKELPDPFAIKKPVAPEKPEPPKPPAPPSATFVASGLSPNQPQTSGNLSKIAAFGALALKETVLAESTGGKPEFAGQHGVVVRSADHFGANLQAFVIPFFKKAVLDDQQRKRRKQEHDDREAEEQLEAEEQALGLLDQVLELAEDAEDPAAFSSWLDERAQAIEWELVKRLGSLPSKAEKMLEILHQASEALRHGVPPAHIRTLLVQDIALRKQKRMES
jgi:hypothetical protein